MDPAPPVRPTGSSQSLQRNGLVAMMLKDLGDVRVSPPSTQSIVISIPTPHVFQTGIRSEHKELGGNVGILLLHSLMQWVGATEPCDSLAVRLARFKLVLLQEVIHEYAGFSKLLNFSSAKTGWTETLRPSLVRISYKEKHQPRNPVLIVHLHHFVRLATSCLVSSSPLIQKDTL